MIEAGFGQAFDQSINSSRVMDIEPELITENEKSCIDSLQSLDTHWSTKLDCLQEIDDVLTSGKISRRKTMKIATSIQEPISIMVSAC